MRLFSLGVVLKQLDVEAELLPNRKHLENLNARFHSIECGLSDVFASRMPSTILGGQLGAQHYLISGAIADGPG